MKAKQLYFLFLFAFISACQKSNPIVITLPDAEYLLSDTSQWAYFSVDSIALNDNAGTMDTFHFIMRQKFQLFLNNSTEKIYHIWREKILGNDTFDMFDYYRRFTQNEVTELNDYNAKELLLNIPANSGSRWNINMYSNLFPIWLQVIKKDETVQYKNRTYTNALDLYMCDSSALDYRCYHRIFQKQKGIVECYQANTNMYSGKWSGYILSYQRVYIK